MQEQAGKLMHTTVIYLHPTIARYAEKLAKTYPEDSGLEVSYFTNSGSESNDLAVMMARLSTDRFDVISLRNGYHGGTHATMGFTAQSNWKMPLPVNMGVHYALPGYCYRCPLGLTYPACDVKCARDIGEVIRYQTSGQVACFISEIVQGVGGTVTPPKEYFQIAYEEVRKAGGLCIADEVQTGFGRTGEHFWGFENYNVHPDLVTTAKGIGNGAALGAVTTRADVAEPLAQKLHFNTFGGNPVSMAAGLATLEVIEGEKIQQNAKVVGAHLKARLRELQDKYPIIGEVRGMGLMLGVELVRDRGTKEPADTETAEVVELARERGLLIGKGSVFKNVLRIKPPMCITTDDANFIGDCLDEVFSRIEQHD
jgi:alanine-glyoxylate transaminase/(R)-3-amino-2-methylpropionate-pyruvate transaminase